MPVDTLATASDLAPFPGAPFDDFLVTVAGESVRADAGWHIAPVRTETLYLRTYGGTYLPIPSLRVVSINKVRYGTPLVEYTTGWTVAEGGLYLRGGWGVGAVEVDITHGFDETPLELLPLIASRVQGASLTGVSSVTSGGHSVTFDPGRVVTTTSDAALDRYRLPSGLA